MSHECHDRSSVEDLQFLIFRHIFRIVSQTLETDMREYEDRKQEAGHDLRPARMDTPLPHQIQRVLATCCRQELLKKIIKTT